MLTFSPVLLTMKRPVRAWGRDSMAIVNNPPHVQAEEARQAALERRMNSADPVERWQAREQLIGSYAAQMGRAAVAEAEKNARRLDAQMRFYERSDRENCPYKPLPHNAKVTK